MLEPETLAHAYHLVDEYRATCSELAKAHLSAASANRFVHLALGTSSTALAAVTAATAFATAAKNATGLVLYVLAMVSILSGVLAALTTFLRQDEHSQQHRIAARGFEAVKRDLDILKLKFAEGLDDPLESLQTVKGKLDDVSASAPVLSNGDLKQAKRLGK